MAVSPDDRFAGLLNASAERGGWVPGDIFTADSAGDEETIAPRRVRMPVLIAVAVAAVGVLVLAFFLFRPAPQHPPAGDDGAGAAGAAQTAGVSPAPGEPAGAGSAASEATGDGTGAGTGGTSSAAVSGKVIVHITGAVKEPSVVTLKAGARVKDAVAAAGGLAAGADAESVNLARVLADGEQIHIPKEGENPAGTDGADPNSTGAGGTDPNSTGSTGAPGSGAAAGKVNLNLADSTTLQTLPGVGPVTAEAIISHRQEQPFAAVEDLLLVKGIGPKTFESLRDLVTVG